MSISPLDFILLQFGSPGYYLAFLGFLICCLQLPIVFTEYLFRYYNYEPPHRCRITADDIRRSQHQWKDFNVHKNEWYPIIIQPPSIQQHRSIMMMNTFVGSTTNSSSHQIFDQCNIFIDPVHHWKGKQPCPNGWEYWWPNGPKNLITEFNLVCEQKQWLTILTNVICLSALFGAIIFGIIADRFGRCRMLNSTIYLFVASALSVYFVADFIQFSIFYNLQIFFVNGLQISAYVLLLELYPTPYQLKANFMWFIFHSLVLILISILVFAINDWRYMQLAIAVPSFAFITYLFVLPSSPLWQTIVQQNQKAAIKTLRHFSKFNDTTTISLNQITQHVQNLFTSTLTAWIQPPYEQQQQQQLLNGRQSNISVTPSPKHSMTIVKTTKPSLSRPGPILRWFLLTNFYLFFVITIINSELFEPHALILNQNPYVNTIYNSLIDLSFIIVIYHLTIWLGSRIIQSLLFFLNGLMIIISLISREYLAHKSKAETYNFDYRLLLLPPIIMVIARSIGRTIVIFISFHAAKSIPTNISVPHLIVLANYLPYNALECMFGILAICNGGLSLLFPNLEQKPLPNTLIDLEERKYSSSSSMATTTMVSSTFSLSSKRYPSYRDLKTYTKSRSTTASSNDIYMIANNNNNNNGELFSSPNSNYNTIRSSRKRSSTKNNGGREILIHGTDIQNSNSLSSSNGQTNRTETERTSLSSTGHDRIGMNDSPSNSFTAQITQQNNNSRPSYIPYNDVDPFILELNSRLQQHEV
nr:organic cation transporter 1-like isoform X2 [Dermatophagoides farinae]